MKYEKIVADICGDTWQESGSDELDGGFGVAMIIAFIQGVSPSIRDLSYHLEVPAYALDTAYKRLQVNGLLSSRSYVLRDPLLRGSSNTVDGRMLVRRAWCHIAGLASGFIGKGFLRDNSSKDNSENKNA